jgi:predicted dehydrogenase
MPSRSAPIPKRHADLAIEAFATGAHVFCEKPLAENIQSAERVVAAAHASGKALLIGYILRVHPSWTRFVEIGQTLGKPLAMRMNLNQQSSGSHWNVHKNLMRSTSPIVDCGVHYVDVMCRVTQAKPVAVHAVGARMTDEISPNMYNYGHLHISFSDGSVGWYEAGWGPMMSETAFFVKDMIGPKGAVSITAKESAGDKPTSADHDGHTRTNALRLHHSELRADGSFARPDEIITTAEEPGHQDLCDLEQKLFLDAIVQNRDLSGHHEEALNSLRIVFAADESIRTGEVVRLYGPSGPSSALGRTDRQGPGPRPKRRARLQSIVGPRRRLWARTTRGSRSRRRNWRSPRRHSPPGTILQRRAASRTASETNGPKFPERNAGRHWRGKGH